jgi:uncharacterized radical SAM superfamily Fe-S cluster-containing enzyme
VWFEGNLDKTPIFNGNRFKLRREQKRILLYEIDPDFSTTLRIFYLPPLPAIFLTLCNGKRTELEIVKSLQYVFDLDDLEAVLASARATIGHLLQQIDRGIILDNLSLQKGIYWRDYDPLEFVMRAKEVDIGGHRLDSPLDINYIVTQVCERRCIYCFAETTQAPDFGLLPLERFFGIMKEAHDLKVNSIIFGGGDSFCRKDIIELVSSAMQSGIVPFLSTKSYLSLKICKR